jgi:hypothetical protein
MLRGFSVPVWYGDYVTPSVAIGIYSINGPSGLAHYVREMQSRLRKKKVGYRKKFLQQILERDPNQG